MLDRVRRIREPYRMLLIGLATAAVLVVGKTWPAFEYPVWGLFLGVLAALLYADLRQPVNYESLEFDSVGFVFRSTTSAVVAARWEEVNEVFYCRDFNHFANQIDTEWHFLLQDGSLRTVLVEWPHRSKFAEAIVNNVNHVSATAVKEVMAQTTEGRWSVVDAAPLA